MILADKRPNDFMSTLSNVKFHEVPLTALLSVTELELDILRVVRTFAAQTRDELRIVFARADKNPSCGAAAAASPRTSVIMETWTRGETPQWERVKN